MNKPTDFTIGQRVQLHPATDLWMRGARYATVRQIGRRLVTISLDVTGKWVRVHPRNLLAA